MVNYITKIILFFICIQICFSKNDYILINLITTNDIHGVISEQSANFMNPQHPPQILGGSALAKYIKETRQEATNLNEGVLFLDGGNFFQGHPIGTMDKGKTIIDWMNYLQYDAVVPGRYDFIFGANNLNQLINQSKFPFLGANINCNNCTLNSENIQPYIIKKINGIKIGILGIVSSGLNDWVLGKNKNGISIDSEVKTLKKWVPILKNLGTDVIIILTSSGVPWNRDKVYSKFTKRIKEDNLWNPQDTTLNSIEMGYFAEGVDIIISGGENKGYSTAWYDPNSHVYIFQNYGNGTEFGHIKMKIDKESKHFIGFDPVVNGKISQTTLSDDFEPDIDAGELIQAYNKQALDLLYAEKINWNKSLIDTDCYKKGKNYSIDNWNIPSINTLENIEILTWNCEFFPTSWEKTINTMAELISNLDADIYALQEIRYRGWFDRLMEKIPDYEYIISQQSSFMDQAIIYRSGMFHLIRQIEPFADNDYNFAGRPPLRGDFLYICGGDTLPLSIIDLHSKCCDSGLWRRQEASKMLYNYVSKELDDGYSNFIILGDWNDDLRDKANEHSFSPFLKDDRFYFVNEIIINDPKQVTYPKEPYVSFLDHILTTTNLVPKESEYFVQTLPIADYMGGYEIYEDIVSDHLPVLLRFSPK